MESFQQTCNEPSRSTSSASDDGFPGGGPLQFPGRNNTYAQSLSRPVIHSPWIQRLRSVERRPCHSHGSFSRLRTVSLSSFSSARHVGNFLDSMVVSSEVVHISENSRDSMVDKAAETGDGSLESSQPVGSMYSEHFVQSNSADKKFSIHSLPTECLLNSSYFSRSPPKGCDTCRMEKLEVGKFEDFPVGTQGRMLRDDWLSSFEDMQRCSAGKGLHEEVQGSFPLSGVKNTPWSTELSSFHDTCSTSSSALIGNPHCNNIGVSRPLVLENNSDTNKMAISGKYAPSEKILHVNKYNSQTFSGVKGIHKNGQECKQLEIVDGNSGLSVGNPNLAKTENLWTSRFKETSLPNKAIQGGGNIDGPLQGSSEDVIGRSITKDKGVYEIHPSSRKEKLPTLSTLLWVWRWRCSNVRVTQRLMKTCSDPNQKCRIDSVIKGSIDSNTSDTCGSLKIVQDPVQDDSVERG